MFHLIDVNASTADYIASTIEHVQADARFHSCVTAPQWLTAATERPSTIDATNPAEDVAR